MISAGAVKTIEGEYIRNFLPLQALFPHRRKEPGPAEKARSPAAVRGEGVRAEKPLFLSKMLLRACPRGAAAPVKPM